MTESPSTQPTPLVVCVAPNGARRQRSEHQALPITPAQLAFDAVTSADAGASVMHLHVRDAAGHHSLEPHHYRSALQAIQERVGDRILVQVTTESVGIYTPKEQMAIVRELKPAAASVALSELAPTANDLAEALGFFHWAGHADVALQFIVYSVEQALRLMELARHGDLGTDRPNTLFVLGRHTVNQQSEPRTLLDFLSIWPSDTPWTVCAFGRSESQCMASAIGLGGHVRVGFENNLLLPNGTLAPCNAALVANIRDLAAHAGRALATSHDARTTYGASRSY